MEQPPPKSPVLIVPDSTETTPINPTFPTLPDPVLKTETEIARHHVTTTRHLTYSLINKLARIQQRLSSDLGFEREEDNLMVTRRWADEVIDVAWGIVCKAGRLVDDVDCLIPRLEGEEDEKDEEAEKGADKTQVNGQNEESKRAGGHTV